MRALLIVNTYATSTTEAGRDLIAHALASVAKVEVAHTEGRGHAAELAANAAAAGFDAVIAHGGDGTISEAVNGLLGPDPEAPLPHIPLGVVPGGSANAFARSLGLPNDPVAAANELIGLIEAGRTRRVSLGHGDGRWFILNAGVGLDADACAAIDAGRSGGRPVTPNRFVRVAVRVFFAAKRRDPALTVLAGAAEPVGGVHYVFVSNASPWTYLGDNAVRTNPGTSFDSGLGLFGMRETGLGPSLRVVRQLLAAGGQPDVRGLVRDDDAPAVRVLASRPMALQMDGEYLGTRQDVTFVSIPRALEVLAPPPRPQFE